MARHHKQDKETEMSELSVLQPAKLGGIELRNRLVVPPMATYLADPKGRVTDELIAYARARAAGGFGLYIVEATYVDPVGKGFTRGVGIDADDKIPGLRRLTDAVHAAGGKISIQLHHAGRETTSAITGMPIVAPSDCPVCYSDEAVHELSVSEIHDIVRRFAMGARRAREAGFDAVMIHGAHGYLLTQFLSPYTNKRTDAYGGSLENRLRISLEIIEAVRKEVGPAFPVTYRMTTEEGVPGGLTLQESARAAKALCAMPIDCLHVVAGNYATNQLIIPPASYGDMTNRPRLQVIRAAVGPDAILAVSGRITNVFQAEALYREGLADFIGMGRASLADPELPKRAARGDHRSIRSCIGCNDGCIGRTSREISVGCAINPLTGHEREVETTRAGVPKKILVIGGGPAGMESAWLAAQRGHKVILCEKEGRLGGQFLLAAYPPKKNDIFIYLEHMAARLAEAGVETRLGCTADPSIVEAEKPDMVLLATGGTPLRIPFPGLESLPHTTAQAVLRNGLDDLGKRVAIIGGGMVGCETAEFIADTGRQVNVIEMQPTVLGELFFTVRDALLGRLESKGVRIHTDRKVLRYEDGYGVAADSAGTEKKIGPVDTVILALGVKPDEGLAKELATMHIPFIRLGDCEKQGNCRHATSMALETLGI